MKKLILLSTVVAAGVVLAGDVETSNSYGVLPVTTSQKATMVAVPFVGDGANISINQMVKAANLNTGDKIFALPSGNNVYQVWELNNIGGSLSWTPCVGVSVGEGTQFTAPSAAGTTIARGQAFWLVRGSATATTFYVMGIGDTTAADPTTLSTGWNLVGLSSATTSKTLADLSSAFDSAKKWSIRLDDGTQYNHGKDGCWYSVVNNSANKLSPANGSGVTLPVGKGFWIIAPESGSVNL